MGFDFIRMPIFFVHNKLFFSHVILSLVVGSFFKSHGGVGILFRELFLDINQ